MRNEKGLENCLKAAVRSKGTFPVLLGLHSSVRTLGDKITREGDCMGSNFLSGKQAFP